MRKFNLFDKVEFIEKNTGAKNVGCIVGFTTEEDKDGCIINKESGTCVDPDEHAYILFLGEMSETGSRFEEFTETELCIPVPSIDFIGRIVNEKDELDKRANKLCDFVRSEKFNTLSMDMRRLMVDQYDTMVRYSKILGKRLELLNA